MAKGRTSVRMQTQIKVMSEQGHSIRTIARVLRLSRRTVRKYLEPVAEPTSGGGGWEEKVDWEYVRQEVNGKGITVKQIGREVAPDIEYVKFWRAFRERVAARPNRSRFAYTTNLGKRPRSISATGCGSTRAGFSAPIAKIPMSIRPTATLPITWALRSCRPGPTSRGTRDRENPRSGWFKEISFKKSVTGFSIRSPNSTRRYAST